MTKTSHSKIYSTESGITGGGFFKTHPLHFTKEQLEWIENIQLPKRLFLISATEFDDRYLYLHDDWRYRFSGNNLAILFSTGKYFCDLSPVSLKLLKYLTIAYINENSASVADKFAQFVATTFKQIEVITRESLIEKMQMLVAKTERNHSDSSQFYYTLYALRKLDRNGFFESKDDSDELEDLLLEVPRPRNNNWARYQNLDLVIPEEVCLMIENGIQRWASKLCPKIDVEENKNIHLETVRKTIKIDTLRDCIIIGIVYYIGARPVQIGKLSGGDFIVDTENKYGMRYSVLVPYAKKSKLTIDRVRVAIPEELGKLILLYKYLVGIGDTDPMFSIIVSSMKMVEASLKKMLFRFSPQEIQEAVKNDDYQLPVYTASLFRHNVGHSMAMSGASAPELGGTQNRKSIFDHFNLFEDDGSRVIIKKHVPRHNINTFLAIAGVTDHIQAILMGRVDITQNKHYQHQAESQSYQTASLAINMLEKAYDENNQALTKSFQLSLFTTQQKPCIPVNLPSPRTEVSRRMAALSRSSKTVKNTGVGNVKLTTSLMINPELNTEHNLKQNMQTFGETTAEVVDYITGTMSDKFLPELKRAHDKLVQQNLADKAKSLLQRHAKLHPLGFGACTRDVARWGCPHALKCQSGLPCGYFTLTGRLGEAEEASRRLSNKRKEIIQLRKLTIVNPGFMLALKEQEEALIVLEALEADAIKVQGEKKLVSLFSDDLNNPLYKVIERINKQMLIGKTPKTLADLFFIEQKRIERNNNG
ncbi:hypothetical protein OFS28_23430 [Escherichia coli]|nr:hypothetical protein [Escherichia coli]